MRPDMVNQLRVVATLVETHLELDAGGVVSAAAQVSLGLGESLLQLPELPSILWRI